MTKNNTFKKTMMAGLVMSFMLMLFMGLQTKVMAAAPVIEDIEYKGSGRMDVEFYGDVRYKKCKITVKDTAGKKYKVSNIKKDDDDVKFTIVKYKKGKTYKITIKGLRKAGTKKYSKVTCKKKIPAATSKLISKKTALSKAKNHAKTTWGATDFYDVSVEKDRENGKVIWEVSFNGKENGKYYEYDYDIDASSGKIIKKDRELDD